MEPITRVLAGVVLAVCLVLLLRMAIGLRRRERLDAALRRLTGRWRRPAAGRSPPAPRVDPREAARVADEAIRRAARRGRWEGNVYKPDAFRPPDDDRSERPDRRKPH